MVTVRRNHKFNEADFELTYMLLQHMNNMTAALRTSEG
jgi:hypothetical protein